MDATRGGSPRGPNGAGGMQRLAPGAPSYPPNKPMTRAEKFEDEKNRITTSCFQKLGEDGRLLESYITHIRVEEDAMYPSSPPHPDSNPEYKKPRVIIAAVKNNGRVHLHKARENADGQFQIGKSWPLDELQSIESFTETDVSDPERAQHIQWAGKVGFMITMNKPYFWAAKTQKEKDFFINSLVKIYRKFTKGKIPRLSGFSHLERDELMAASAPPSQAPSGAISRMATPPQAGAGLPPPLPATTHLRPDSRDAMTSGTVTPRSHDSRQQTSYIQDSTATSRPQLSAQPSQDSGMRNGGGLALPRPPYAASPPSSRGLSPQASLPSLQGNRKDSVSSQDYPSSFRQETESIRSRLGQYGAAASASSDSLPLSVGHAPAARTNGEQDGRIDKGAPRGKREPVLEAPFEQKLPERRRPPLHESEYRSPRKMDDPSDPDVVKPLVPKPPQQQVSSRPSTGNNDAMPPTRERTTPYTSPGNPPPTQQRGSDDVFTRKTDSPEAASSETTLAESEQTDEPTFRPGLGPMMGKRVDLANKFRKAAAAHTAFKPRAGGAGDRLFAAKAKTGEEADGVTRVVPAPLAKPESPKKKLSLDRTSVGPASPARVSQERPQTPVVVPPVQSTRSPSTPEAHRVATPDHVLDQVDGGVEKLAAPKRAGAPRIKRQRSNKYAKAFTSLDIDPLIFEGRHIECENALADFGWSDTILKPRKLEAVESDLRREIGRLEAGSWHGHTEQKDDRVEIVEMLLDKAIKECDEMEGLLTLYGVELGTLNDDVTYIEAQSQGLQVQTANQKLLHSELETLIDTLSISDDQLEPLRRAIIHEPAGLDAIEGALLLLSRALRTIDPSLFSSAAAGKDDFGDGELFSMRALQDKKQSYQTHANDFLRTLRRSMDAAFEGALRRTNEALAGHPRPSFSEHTGAHDLARETLWQYSALMLFAKEIDPLRWDELMRTYQGRVQPLYQNEIKSGLDSWRKATRKPTAEELDAVFTTVLHKDSDSITTTARKLTIKRSQTLAKGLRSAVGDRKKAAQAAGHEARYESSEAFSLALEDIITLVSHEQNFVIDFFHATTTENTDFVELVSSTSHTERKKPNIRAEKHVEPDRTMAEKIIEIMEGVFGVWATEMRSFLDWAAREDPLQGIGILYALEVHRARLEDTNQDFAARTLQKLHEHLSAMVTRFIDDQIRAIEEAKIKRKKKSGVIAFVKVFPNFAAVVENMVPPESAREAPEVRALVDSAYDRINKAIFEGVRALAKESSVNVPGAYGIGLSSSHTADPEDKERLHYHIMYLQNLFHYKTQLGDVHRESKDARDTTALGNCKARAEDECKEHQHQYLSAVIRRPMGKLLDFLEAMEMRINALHPGEAPSSIALTNPSQNKEAFRKALKGTDPKNLKSGVSKDIKQRIHRHFEDSEDESNAQKLQKVLLEECEQRYLEILDRATTLATRVYDGEVRPEFSRADIAAAFQGRS